MKLVYVSGTRADYGLVRSTLVRLGESSVFELSVLVSGNHMSQDFGFTIREIEADGFSIFSKVDTLPKDDSGESMVMALGSTIVAMANTFSKNRPDLVLLLGDRDEQLAAALVASHLGIPIAHIHGGERSGSIDDTNRHAISRYAHLHLVATKDAQVRLIKMGEPSDQIHVVGAPGIDEMRTYVEPDLVEVRKYIPGFSKGDPYLLLVQHPNTDELGKGASQIQETLAAIRETKLSCIAFLPNSDAGNADMRSEILKAGNEDQFAVVDHCTRSVYLYLLKNCQALVGNSSSGIIEAPYFCKPAINVGTRQKLRFHGRNVIHVSYDRHEIFNAIQKSETPEFKKLIQEERSIYGDGHAAEKILKILSDVDWRSAQFMRKEITY